MKWPSFLIVLLFSLHSYGQQFELSPNFYTVNASGGFDFHISGNAHFTDSLQIFYSVKSADSTSAELFSQTIDFGATNPTLPEGFVYDAGNHTFSIALGTYPHKNLVLELKSSVNGEILEYLVISIPQREASNTSGN